MGSYADDLRASRREAGRSCEPVGPADHRMAALRRNIEEWVMGEPQEDRKLTSAERIYETRVAEGKHGTPRQNLAPHLASDQTLARVFGEHKTMSSRDLAEKIIHHIRQHGSDNSLDAIAAMIDGHKPTQSPVSINLLRELTDLRDTLANAQARIDALEKMA